MTSLHSENVALPEASIPEASLPKAALPEVSIPEDPTPSTESKKTAVKRRYDAAIVSVLEEQYAKKPRVNAEERSSMSHLTGLSPEQIAKWFANQRRKDRKSSVTSELAQVKTENQQNEETHQETVESAGNVSDQVQEVQPHTETPSTSSQAQPDMQAWGTALMSILSLLQQNGTPSAPTDSGKRHQFTEEQRKGLMKAFEEDRNPTSAKREQLAQKFGLRTPQVTRWFQNRRHILNKEKKVEPADV